MVVYGDVEAPPASEETVCHPLPGHAYALSKLEAEQQLHQMAAHGDTEPAVARIAQVYSANSPSIRRFPQLAALVTGYNWTHFVHREDAVRALTLLMRPDHAPGTYNVDHVTRMQRHRKHEVACVASRNYLMSPTASPLNKTKGALPPPNVADMQLLFRRSGGRVRRCGLRLFGPSR